MLILLTSGAEALKQGGAEEGPDQTFQPVAPTGLNPCYRLERSERSVSSIFEAY
jgi:hypothetical protein